MQAGWSSASQAASIRGQRRTVPLGSSCGKSPFSEHADTVQFGNHKKSRRGGLPKIWKLLLWNSLSFFFINETVSQIDDLQIPSPSDMKTLHLTGFMKENIQTCVANAISHTLFPAGGIFTCNANKTELTVGYGTLYGDLSGALAATADLWKHQIYALGRTLNRYFDKNMIPDEIFTVRPSAELSENQDITKGLGDPLIYEYMIFSSARLLNHGIG